MQKQQSSLMSFFKKRKTPDSPSFEEAAPKKPKLSLVLSSESEEEVKETEYKAKNTHIVDEEETEEMDELELKEEKKPVKKANPKTVTQIDEEETVEMRDLPFSSDDDIEEWDSSDTEILDMDTIDKSIRSIPYRGSQINSSPAKTREVFVYSSPQKAPEKKADSKPQLAKTPTVLVTESDDEGVQWYWKSDNSWEKYSTAVNTTIEKAFKNKETRVSVDKHRYISFLDMLQLRFDDIFKTRSRGVQRRVQGKVWTGKPSWLPTRTDSGRIVPSSETVDFVTPVEAQWYWQNDHKGWEKFATPTNAILEEARKQKREIVQIDSERSVNIKREFQFRMDNPTRIRKIKREEIRSLGKPSPVVTSPFFSKTKMSNDLQSQNVSVVGEWSWLGEDDTWHPYSKEISEKIEFGYVNKTENKIPVDDERYVDLSNMFQRRYDDGEKKRYILRSIPEKQLKHLEQKLSPQQQLQIQANKEAAKKRLAENQKKKQMVFLIDEPPKTTSGSEDTISMDDDATVLMDEIEIKSPKGKEPSENSDIEDEEEKSKNEEKKKAPSPEELLAWKRSQYKCKDKYVQLKDIPSWTKTLKNDPNLAKSVAKSKKYPANSDINSVVSLWRGDITTMEIDAIVNAAKASLLGGGGIDGAIHKAAGHGLVQECSLIGGCKPGQAVITQGYRLPAKHVIHTVGPIGEKKNILRNCYLSVLKKAVKWNVKTLAFCCISTGIYGYPNEPAAKVALKTVRTFLQEKENYSKFDRIIFVMFLNEDLKIYTRLMSEKYFAPK
eukprot:TRINITY_DN8087_c0_g1_i2.p1 TRINITY_DN8087_c0_g1~~TRINITY_DN8087_c0_g1_i2.p1  ORF type:complete len:778 (+),score=195.79 TRINITY_DN8087_c0_g1_i2:18-2351(+)